MWFKDGKFCKLFQHHGKWRARVLRASGSIAAYLEDDSNLVDDMYTGTKWQKWINAIAHDATFNINTHTYENEAGEPVFYVGLIGNTDGVDPFDERKIKKTCWPLMAFLTANLPPAIRCDQRYRLIHSIVGGPKAPSAEHFQNYVRLVCATTYYYAWACVPIKFVGTYFCTGGVYKHV